jgi:hypothetical protein
MQPPPGCRIWFYREQERVQPCEPDCGSCAAVAEALKCTDQNFQNARLALQFCLPALRSLRLHNAAEDPLEEVSTEVAGEASTEVEVEASMEAVVASTGAAVQVEVSTRVAASKGEACVPAVSRHRAWAEALRARCPACLRGSGQDPRQDLVATFIVRIVAPGAEANGPRFRRPLTHQLMDSGIPLAARLQDGALRGPHPGLEIQPARAGRHLAGIGRPVKPTR